jgi:hypothetical protein
MGNVGLLKDEENNKIELSDGKEQLIKKLSYWDKKIEKNCDLLIQKIKDGDVNGADILSFDKDLWIEYGMDKLKWNRFAIVHGIGGNIDIGALGQGGSTKSQRDQPYISKGTSEQSMTKNKGVWKSFFLISKRREHVISTTLSPTPSADVSASNELVRSYLINLFYACLNYQYNMEVNDNNVVFLINDTTPYVTYRIIINNIVSTLIKSLNCDYYPTVANIKQALTDMKEAQNEEKQQANNETSKQAIVFNAVLQYGFMYEGWYQMKCVYVSMSDSDYPSTAEIAPKQWELLENNEAFIKFTKVVPNCEGLKLHRDDSGTLEKRDVIRHLSLLKGGYYYRTSKHGGTQVRRTRCHKTRTTKVHSNLSSIQEDQPLLDGF